MAKIAILGFGTVGSGVYEVMRKNSQSIARKAGQEVEIKYILDIRSFSGHPEESLFIKDYDIILNDPEIDIVAEVIGGLTPAYEFTKKALLRGKSVVTSNKELVAAHAPELLKIAAEHSVSYLFEASVGGGIPIIRPLHQCLAANEIYEIMGILNGTTNFILTQMFKKGRSFGDALKDAQERGYAETDPAADGEGKDACRKIAILASLAFGRHVDSNLVETCGITALTPEDVKYADEMGCVIKLLGYAKAEDNEVTVWVGPAMLPEGHSLAGVDDVFNGILVKGDAIGDVMFYGRGAGKLPTASAVVADVIDIVRNSVKGQPILWQDAGGDFLTPPELTAQTWFVRAEYGGWRKAKAIFGDIKYVSVAGLEEEFGFVTDKMSRKELDVRLTLLGGIKSVIRMIEDI